MNPAESPAARYGPLGAAKGFNQNDRGVSQASCSKDTLLGLWGPNKEDKNSFCNVVNIRETEQYVNKEENRVISTETIN